MINVAKYLILVKDWYTEEVVETIPCETKRLADVVIRGVDNQLNHAKYYVEMFSVEKGEIVE